MGSRTSVFITLPAFIAGVATASNTLAQSAGLTDSIDGILNCGPLSTAPANWPAYTQRIAFRIQNGSLSADWSSNKSAKRPLKETYTGSVDDHGLISISGQGEYQNHSGGWTYKLSGHPKDKSDIVLTGELRNGWGKGNGTRKCTLAFLGSIAQVRAKLAKPSAVAELKKDQQRLEAQQASTAAKVEGVVSVLRDIVLPVTERPNDWMMRVAAVPVQQQQFCRIVDRFYDDLAQVYQARNDIKKNALFRDRQKDLASLLPNGTFENWVVTIKEVAQAADGSAAVMLQPPCRAMLGSDACQKEPSKIRATIPASSPMFRELERVSTGDFIVVSGRILYAATETPDAPLPIHALYEAGSHCSAVEGGKKEDVFVTEIRYLARLQ